MNALHEHENGLAQRNTLRFDPAESRDGFTPQLRTLQNMMPTERYWPVCRRNDPVASSLGRNLA